MQYGDITLQDEARVLPGSIIVQFTRDSALASGTQGITGVGFRPTKVVFISTTGTTNKSSWGMSSREGLGSMSMRDNNSDVAGTYAINTSNAIQSNEGAGNEYLGAISSYDVDGFTVTWTRNLAPTGIITIVALVMK